MEFEDNIFYYKCPITKKIFKDPVLSNDGYNYEREVIEKLPYYFISPVTSIKTINKYFPNNQLKAEIDEFIFKNEKYKTDIFKGYDNTLISFTEKKFDSLLNLQEFDWFMLNSIINNSNIITYFNSIDVSILNHLIKVGINIDNSNNTFSIIEVVAIYGNSTTIDLLEEKSIDLKYVNQYNENLLSLACKFNSFETVKRIVKLNLPYLKSNNDINWYPLHYVCWYNNSETLKLILDTYQNIETQIYLSKINKFISNIKDFIVCCPNKSVEEERDKIIIIYDYLIKNNISL